HRRGIERIEIERDKAAATVKNVIEGGCNSPIMDGACSDELGAPGLGIANLTLAGGADAARPNLHHRVHMGHLGCPPHGIRESHALASPFVAPVDMGIDL